MKKLYISIPISARLIFTLILFLNMSQVFAWSIQNPPSNDDCTNATLAYPIPYVNSQDASTATNNAGFIAVCGPAGHNDGVWYKVIGNDTNLTVTIKETTLWDSEIGIYSGICGNFICIDSIDTADDIQVIDFFAEQGVTYFISIGSYSGFMDNPEGSFNIEVAGPSNATFCFSPESVSSSNISIDEAEINWNQNSGNPNEWEVKYGISGFDLETEGISATTNTNSITLENLNEDTSYDVYVRANCSATNQSEWTPVHTFTTEANPCTATEITSTEIISNTSLKIFWQNDGQAQQWQVVYGVSGFNVNSGGTTANLLGSSNAYTVNNLTSGQTYDFYVRARCGATSFSAYTSVETVELPNFVYRNGSWYPNSPEVDASASDNMVVVNGETTLTSETSINNIEVKNGATLNIGDVLNLNGNITNNGSLVFLSTAIGDGELAQVLPTSTISGEITVQRYLKGKRSYRMLSSAVNSTNSIHSNWQEGAASSTDNPNSGFGTHITGSTVDQQNGFDGTFTGSASMFNVNASTQAFEAINNTDVNQLTAGHPYFMYVRGSRAVDLTATSANQIASETILRATGSLHLGDQQQNFNINNAGDFVMFGNPYQATVDMASVVNNSNNVNTSNYYVYDPSVGDFGGYVTYDFTLGFNSNFSSEVDQYLQPGQGAQIAGISAGNVSVNFSEADKAPGNYTSTNKMLSSSIPLISGSLFTTQNFNNDDSAHDGFLLAFNNSFTNNVSSEDAIKPMNIYENMGINNDGQILSIEKRKFPDGVEIIQFFNNNYQSQDYTLVFDLTELSNQDVYLNDAYTGTKTVLTNGQNTYQFTVNQSIAESVASDRFSLVFGVNPSTDLPDYIFVDNLWHPNSPEIDALLSDNMLVVEGETTLNTETSINNIEVRSGATLNIGNVLNLNGNITNNGDLIFLSTATSDGELAQVSPTSTITGDVTVQRYLKPKRSYRMLASSVNTPNSIHANWQEGASSSTENPNPVFGTHITGSTVDQQNGFDGTFTGNASMFTVNASTQSFQAVGNTDENQLAAGQPYFMYIRGSRAIDLTATAENQVASETILRAKGSLHLGDQQQNFTINNDGDFVMFGNPYQATVDMASVLGNSSNINTTNYYVYDPTVGDFGGYVTYDFTLDFNSNPTSEVNQFLQPGQGAQIAGVSAGNVNLNFSETDKATGNHTSTNKMNSESDLSFISASLFTTQNFNSNASAHDAFLLAFGETFNNNVTTEDAKKPMNLYENLGVDYNGNILSIDKRQLPENSEIIQLFTDGYHSNEYTFSFTLNQIEGVSVYLNDAFNNTQTELFEGENTYQFMVDESISESMATSRFSLSFEENSLSVNEKELNLSTKIYPNPTSDGNFTLDFGQIINQEVQLVIYDLLGRKVFETSTLPNNSAIEIETSGVLKTGVYQVQIFGLGKPQNFKLIKK